MKTAANVFILFIVTFASCATRGMSRERANAHARELAKSIIILDGHIDVPYRLYAKYEDVTEKTAGGDFDYPRAVEGGLKAPFMSIFTPADLEAKGTSKQGAEELIKIVEAIAARAPGKFTLAKSVADVRRAAADGKIALLMGMENGSPIEGKIDNVQYFYNRGIRYITLCHGADNHICDSSYDTHHKWKGLSPFGREVVDKMNESGIMIDISHVSDDTFYEVMKISKAPVIASHSSCRKFTPGFERNMSDEMIKLLGEKGGVIQINFGSSFIRDDIRLKSWPIYENFKKYIDEHQIKEESDEAQKLLKKMSADANVAYADITDVANHIDHAVSLAGVDHVGLGSDFDGVGDTLPVGLKDVSMYPNLIAELLIRGYSDNDIKKICGENVLRVLSAVETLGSAPGSVPSSVPGTDPNGRGV